MNQDRENIIRTGNPNDITVYYCVSGSAVLGINDKLYEITPGQGYVVLGGKSYSLVAKHDEYRFIETVIPVGMLKESMGINNITADIALISKYPVFELDEKEQEGFIHIIELCENLKSQQGKYKERCVLNTYVSLVLLICGAAEKQHEALKKDYSCGNDRQNYYFISFLNLLSRYCVEERNVGFYADKLFITPKYLSAVVKAVSGKTAGDWIDEFVISEAKQHLRFSGKSIQEISYMLNFSTQSFFGKYFKRLTGVSPVRYKLMAASA